MGGSAFPSLVISRIPNTIYNSLFHHLHPLLTPYYHIIRPPPSPGKLSHGDLDLLALPIAAPPTSLTKTLSAVASTRIKNSPTTSFAVPFPPQHGDGLFQLDIHVCATQRELEWTAFHHSYGDFWSIIRRMLRRAGLKLDDTGLHIRAGQQQQQLTLTREPSEVLRFLGLDGDTFRRGPWKDLAEMFAYIRTCRVFRADAFAVRSAKDRKLLRQREGVRVWVEEFLPTCGEDAGEAMTAEEDVVGLALEWFGKTEEYAAMMEMARRREREKDGWRAVRERLPLKTEREKDLTVRSLRVRWEMMAAETGELEKFAEENWRAEWRRALQNEKCRSASFGRPSG
jgi:hypothetical protein